MATGARSLAKLLVGWKRDLDTPHLQRDPIGEMERLYKTVNRHRTPIRRSGTGSPGASEAQRVIRKPAHLAGDAGVVTGPIRRRLRRLGVKFDYSHGESFYNPKLATIVQNLREKRSPRESEGAICVFSDDSLPPKQDPFLKTGKTARGNPIGLDSEARRRIQLYHDRSRDPGLSHRNVRPDEILYVTGGPQQLHFQQLFAIFPSVASGSEGEGWPISGSVSTSWGRRQPFKTRVRRRRPNLAELLESRGARL